MRDCCLFTEVLTRCFALQSRRSTDPKISTDDLDKYTFNIIPKRDVVPMLDDRSQNFQSKCTSCHTLLLFVWKSTDICFLVYVSHRLQRGFRGRRRLSLDTPLPL
jgi:hypothetical protein